jgi:RNA polymerase sigma-70 factor, ECF subfamily
VRSVPTRPEPDRRARFEAVAAVLYEPLQRFLARRATPDDAADVLADVLLVVWRRLDDVPGDVLPWSYGVARRCLANHRRGAVRRLRLVERAASVPDDTVTFDPQAAVESSEPELVAAIDELSESEREVVHLWAWERLEPREIAVVLDTTPNAVSVALSRAKRKLAERLDRQDHRDRGHLHGANTDQVGARTPEQEGGPG